MDIRLSDGHSLTSVSVKLQTVKHKDFSKDLNNPGSYAHWEMIHWTCLLVIWTQLK